jgi:hypothetical protein
MTNDDNIIADLLKKIDSLQETINTQNLFIMKMATYRDEREDRTEEQRIQRLRDLKNFITSTGLVSIIDKWYGETLRRPPYEAGQPADKQPASEPSEGLDS